MFERSIEVRWAALSAELAAFLEEVICFEESGKWRREGATSMSAWLAGRFAMARGTALELVRMAHALPGLSTVKEAFARGELSLDQLKPLTRFVTPEEDELWACRAPSMSAGELW